MRPKQIRTLIEEAIADPLGTPPVHIWGPPGGGKSAIPRQVAEDAGIGFVDMRLAQRDPTDIRGIPAVIDGKARWLPPPELPTDGRGILFLDELTSCPPLTQASAYQLTLDRGIGEYKLPNGWYIVAAGNRLQDRAVVFRMSTALANRFVHIDFDVNVEDWIDWAMSRGKINPNIIGFIHWRGAELLAPKFDPDSDERAFPSPRTWEFASRLLNLKDKAILAESLQGCVGKGATAEFMAFLKVQTELPDVTKILEGKLDYTPPQNRPDLRYALVSALATRAKKEHYENMLKYSAKLPVEFSVLLVTMLIYRDQTAMATAPGWGKWAKEHSDIIVARKRMV